MGRRPVDSTGCKYDSIALDVLVDKRKEYVMTVRYVKELEIGIIRTWYRPNIYGGGSERV